MMIIVDCQNFFKGQIFHRQIVLKKIMSVRHAMLKENLKRRQHGSRSSSLNKRRKSRRKRGRRSGKHCGRRRKRGQEGADGKDG